MIRNLKALGLALFAFLAFGAMATASASAQTVGEVYETNGSYPVKLHGEDVPKAELTVGEITPSFHTETGNITIECTETTYTGEITKESAALTITPTYHKCWADAAHIEEPATVTMNGCDYNFNDLTTKELGDLDNWKVQVDLECPVGKVVEIHRYASTANHTGGTSNCTMTLAAADNQNLEGLTVYEKTATDTLRLEDEVHPHAVTHGSCSLGLTLNIETDLRVAATLEGKEKKIALTH